MGLTSNKLQCVFIVMKDVPIQSDRECIAVWHKLKDHYM